METIEQILESIKELRIAQKEVTEQMKATDIRMAKLHAETEEFFKASDARFEARLQKDAENRRAEAEKARLENEERQKKREAEAEKARLENEERQKKRDAEAEKARLESEERQKKRDAEEAERQKKRDAEAEKYRLESEESKRAFDKGMKELTDSQKETNKQLGGIGNSNGAYAENFFYQSLKNKMRLGSVKFDEIEKNLKFKRKGLVDEFDTILYNGDSIGLVETKYMVSSANIKQLINVKPQNFKTLCPDYANYKIYLGIAGFSFENEKVKQEAINAGVVVLEAVGDHVEIDATNMKAY